MSLQNKVLCINVRTTCLGSTVTDADLTAGLLAQTNAKKGKLSAKKKILDEGTKPMRQLRGEVNRYIRSVTLPGISEDLRIVTPKRLAEVEKKIKEFQEQDAALVQELADHYAEHKAKDKEDLGGAYDENLYPPVENLAHFFTIRMTTCDLPSGDYFRVEGLSEEAIQKLKESHAKTLESVASVAQNEVHKKMLDLVSKIADKFSDPDAKRLHDSTLDNLHAYLAEVPDLNVTGDPQLDEMRQAALTKLNFTMEQVRMSTTLKEQAAAAAKEFVETFGHSTRKLNVKIASATEEPASE